MSKHPMYATWNLMMARCYNPKHRYYAAYGGRGIAVCLAWLDFAGFLKDNPSKPEGLQMDRINNDKGYSPENCRWATRKDNGRNKRNTVWVTYLREIVPLQVAAEKSGIPAATLHTRKRKNFENIFETRSANETRIRNLRPSPFGA